MARLLLYYQQTNQIKKGGVKVVFCPITDELGHFFMEPFQGSLFVRMRENYFNLHASTSTSLHKSVLEDRKDNAIIEGVPDAFQISVNSHFVATDSCIEPAFIPEVTKQLILWNNQKRIQMMKQLQGKEDNIFNDVTIDGTRMP